MCYISPLALVILAVVVVVVPVAMGQDGFVGVNTNAFACARVPRQQPCGGEWRAAPGPQWDHFILF